MGELLAAAAAHPRSAGFAAVLLILALLGWGASLADRAYRARVAVRPPRDESETTQDCGGEPWWPWPSQ